jgi:serine/threonine-protein kinase
MFRVGETIDGQYVIEKVHVSGMGVVYIARDSVSEKRFALKSVKDEYLSDEGARKRFQHEARVWIQLDRHDHIVQALLYREVQGVPLLFLEYVEGPTLAELLQKDAPLAVAQAVEFAKQFCQAMTYVHGRGVIHRDIKPQNVLITRDCQVRVTDFGLAKVWGVTHGTRGAMGTPFYMSPEQIRDASKVDQRSDIFSFGVMLYEMLTGQRAFEGESVYQVMYQIMEAEPRVPGQGHPQVPEIGRAHV